MVSIKAQIVTALSAITTINLSEEYPQDWSDFSKDKVTYTEENNSVHTLTDETEKRTLMRFRIDVWSKSSTTDTCILIDNVMRQLGLYRISAVDANDPKYAHKVMRYEGVYENDTRRMYKS